jgi:hypothetical protein
VQLLFWNAELLPVLDVMGPDLMGFCFAVPSGQEVAVVRVRIPRLLLNAGKYSVTAIVLSEDLRVFCRHDQALELTVVAACASGASMILPAVWQSNP